MTVELELNHDLCEVDVRASKLGRDALLTIDNGAHDRIKLIVCGRDIEDFAQMVYDALMSAKRKQAAQDDPYAGDKTKGDAFEALRRAEQ